MNDKHSVLKSDWTDNAAPSPGITICGNPLNALLVTGCLVLPLSSYAADTVDPPAFTIADTHRGSSDPVYIEQQVSSLLRDMVDIPEGSFVMGADTSDGENDETPVHRVRIHRFTMGRHEVTFAQWDACTADGGCNGHRAYDKGWGRGNLPVIHITWDDTQNFIGWLNQKTGKQFRLPTEAEWEYAARAGTNTRYSWGDYIGANNANCKECGGFGSGDKTLPVGGFAANRFGLFDMHGNVWEWVADCWHDNYRGAPADGSAWISGDCDLRVIRGGSYFSTPQQLRSANRSFNPRARTASEPGFRLAHDG